MAYDDLLGIVTANRSGEENETNTQEASKPHKLNEFDLEELVLRYATFFKIDNHFYAKFSFPASLYYEEVTNLDALKELLLRYFYEPIRENFKISHVKSCATLLMHRTWPSYISADKYNILCLSNGYLDLNHMEATQFTPYNSYWLEQPYHTYMMNAAGSEFLTNWETNRTLACPCMDRFLNQITEGDPVLTTRIWEILGFLLTPVCQKFLFLFQGLPNSGKSLLGNLIRSYYPPDHIENLDIDQLGKRTATSQLIDKNINMSMDLPNKVLPSLAIRSIKMISGGDDITVQLPNGQYQSCKLNCRFLFATNHPLVLKGRDDAFEDRIICVPFNKSVPKQSQDCYLLQRLLAEKDTILQKALGFYEQLCRNNFVFAGAGNSQYAPTIKYLPNLGEEQRDHILEFIDETCQLVLPDEGATYTADLYRAYHTFCYEKGYTPFNDERAFSRNLHQCLKGKVTKKKLRDHDKTANAYLGIVLDNAAITPLPEK